MALLFWKMKVSVYLLYFCFYSIVTVMAYEEVEANGSYNDEKSQSVVC